MSCSVEFIFQLPMFTVELTYKGIRGILRYGKVKFAYFVVVWMLIILPVSAQQCGIAVVLPKQSVQASSLTKLVYSLP